MNGSSAPAEAAALPPTLFSLGGRRGGGCVVFCPDFGGNVMYARQLVRLLAPDLHCIGARPTKSLIEEPDGVDIGRLGEAFATDIDRAGLASPIHVVGFSFGGFVAFETARHLAALGVHGVHLWIADTQVHRMFAHRYLLRGWRRELRYAVRFIVQNRRRLFARTADPDVLHRYGALRFNLSDHPVTYRTVIRLMYDALARYRPQPWAGTATVFRARHGDAWPHVPDDLGWSHLIEGDLKALVVDADHLGLVHEASAAAKVAGLIQSRQPILERRMHDD